MQYSSPAIERLIEEFQKFPGVGRKTAQRLVFHLLRSPKEEIANLAEAIKAVKEKVGFCSVCFNISEKDPCDICTDPNRDRTLICVVEEASDLWALEKTGEYKGLFHILGGVLSPLDGIGPDDLHMKELFPRLQEGVREVILATNPNTEGEATAVYLTNLIKPLKVKVTRIARGLPMGGDLEYADQVTLAKAIEGRIEI
jgi:recombination protein RecR